MKFFTKIKHVKKKTFYSLEIIVFYLEHHQIINPWSAFLKEKQTWKKFQFFNQKHGLTLQIYKFFDYVEKLFFIV